MKKILCIFALIFTLNLYGKQQKEFALVTMMKTGTHLTRNLLIQLTHKRSYYIARNFQDPSTMKENIFYDKGMYDKFESFLNYCKQINKFTFSHTVFYSYPYGLYSDTHSDFLLITNSRDLRDVIVSLYYHLEKNDHFDKNFPNKLNTIDEKILHCIHSFKRQVEGYYELLRHENVFVVRFEDLVGEKGGGSDEAQKAVLVNLCNALEISLNDNELNNIASNLFGNSGTFRKGVIGEWRKYFKEEHKVAFKKSILGKALIDMGYENDMEW